MTIKVETSYNLDEQKKKSTFSTFYMYFYSNLRKIRFGQVRETKNLFLSPNQLSIFNDQTDEEKDIKAVFTKKCF